MSFMVLLLDIFVLCATAVIWAVILISSFRTFRSGEIEKRFGDKMTKAYRVIGVMVFIFAAFNIYTLEGYSIGMKIINWVAFPTLAIEFLYFGFTGIQFRETALIWNTFVTAYENIESYRWDSPQQITITRKNCWIRNMRITVRSEEKQEIEELLKLKIKGKKRKA